MILKILAIVIAFCLSLNAVEFTDQNGNKFYFKESIKNVALFPIPLASFSLSVENNTSRLASIHPMAKKNIDRAMLSKMIKGSSEIPVGGIGDDFMPNMEELIKLSPDLVIQWGMRGEKLIEPLKKVGLNVALVNLRGTEEDPLFWFDMLGKIYEKEDRVAQILNNRAQTRAKIEEFTKSLQNKPKVLFIFGRDKSYEAAGKKTYFDYEISLSGGKNIANFNGFRIINKEEIIAQNPDIILLSNFDNLTPNDFFQDRLLKSVKAVKNKAIYKMPIGGDMWEPPTGESHLAWLWFSILFSGQNHLSLVEEMRKSYKILYEYDLKDDDIAQILRFDMNGDSKFYDFFKTK